MLKKKLKKWEELLENEKEHFEVSAAIFQDWITGDHTEQLREDLRALLEVRLRVVRTIMPDVLLLQLQYGALGGEQVVDAIMQFDDDLIRQALTVLVEQGLE